MGIATIDKRTQIVEDVARDLTSIFQPTERGNTENEANIETDEKLNEKLESSLNEVNLISIIYRGSKKAIFIGKPNVSDNEDEVS
ncbi:hypothetical protein WA026_010766 [Henosepilachna vigintioctopunctata]|uniref:Uncharacterized protein n=1 Tax=Henosepilachna vigintioctopunctata TaxID=420089 RepID=A0AAW1UVW4_9CUCU